MNGLHFDHQTGELTRGDKAIALPPRAARVFGVLLRSYNAGEASVSAGGIHERAQIGPGASALGVVKFIRRRVAAMQIDIEKRGNRQAAEYRLVDLSEGSST